MTGTKQARGLRTRAELIRAAADVVGRVGYAHATTKAIAEEAGVAEGTIYRHFADKRELVLAVILEHHEEVVTALDRLPSLAGTATVTDNLADIMRSLASLRADLLPLELEALSQRGPTRARPSRSGGGADAPFGPDTLIAAYLAEEQRLGRVRPDLDATLTAHLILATLFGVAVMPTSDDPASYRKLLDNAISVIAAGVVVP